MTDDVRVLIEMAKMYYEENATQNEVAKAFNVSRSLVSKYMSKARDMGIVEITISTQGIHPHNLLEEKLKEITGLEDIICVESSDDMELLNHRMGIACSKYLNRIIRDNMVITVAPGRALHALAHHFVSKIQMPNTTFVPLTGGLGEMHSDIQANVIAELMSRKSGGKLLQLHCPVIVDSAKAREVFMEQSFIKKVMNVSKNADLAIVGIGGKPTYFEMNSAYLHKIDTPVSIDTDNVESDIGYIFLDAEGNEVDSEWNNRVMTLPLESIRNIENVIAIAGGMEKHKGILSAVRGKLIDVLITDVSSAEFLLDSLKEDN